MGWNWMFVTLGVRQLSGRSVKRFETDRRNVTMMLPMMLPMIPWSWFSWLRCGVKWFSETRGRGGSAGGSAANWPELTSLFRWISRAFPIVRLVAAAADVERSSMRDHLSSVKGSCSPKSAPAGRLSQLLYPAATITASLFHVTLDWIPLNWTEWNRFESPSRNDKIHKKANKNIRITRESYWLFKSDRISTPDSGGGFRSLKLKWTLVFFPLFSFFFFV